MNEIDKDVAKERLIYFQEIAEDIKMKYRKNLFNRSSKLCLKINQK